MSKNTGTRSEATARKRANHHDPSEKTDMLALLRAVASLLVLILRCASLVLCAWHFHDVLNQSLHHNAQEDSLKCLPGRRFGTREVSQRRSRCMHVRSRCTKAVTRHRTPGRNCEIAGIARLRNFDGLAI